MKATTAQQLKIVKDGVRFKAPLVAEFFDVTTPLAEYTRAINQYQATPTHRERQELLKKKVREILVAQFTEEELDRANINWASDWKINIVDHHNLLNHPILVSTNIVANLWQLPSEKPEGVIVLSDSGVPMNNFFHKRGIKYHGHQLNLFPAAERAMISFAAPFHPHFPLNHAATHHELSPDEQRFCQRLDSLINTAANQPRCVTFTDQITRINYTLWKQLFAPEIRDQVPDLFYVPNERLCIAMLEEFLGNPQHLFTRVLFDRQVRDIVLKEFEGVAGCWNREKRVGSEFFWGIDQQQRQLSLELRDEKLVSRDSSVPFTIDWTPAAILSALREGKLYPTMFLVYGISIFYCGIRPLVGYGSMNYQTKMKEAWLRTLEQCDHDEMELMATMPIDGFIGGPVVTFGYDRGHGYQSLYAADIIEQGGLTKEYLDNLGKVPFNEVLQPALLDIYDSYLTPDEKQPLTITHNDLMAEGFRWLRKK